MPVRRAIPYRTIIRNLLASKKLTKAERAAFQKISDGLAKGTELTDAQRLWTETLKAKYLAK